MSKEKKASFFLKGLAAIDSVKMIAAWMLELICIAGAGVTSTVAVLFVIHENLRDGILSAIVAVILLIVVILLSITTGSLKITGK